MRISSAAMLAGEAVYAGTKTEAVIRNARRRQHRRRAFLAAAALIAAAAGSSLYLTVGGGGTPATTAGSSGLTVRPLHLPRTPYLGLACDSATANPCVRVGLAVWLRRPARAVSAVVNGRAVTLTTRRGGSGAYRSGLFWQGFFTDRSAQRIADASGSTTVRILASTQTGSTLATTTTVYVSEGYG